MPESNAGTNDGTNATNGTAARTTPPTNTASLRSTTTMSLQSSTATNSNTRTTTSTTTTQKPYDPNAPAAIGDVDKMYPECRCTTTGWVRSHAVCLLFDSVGLPEGALDTDGGEQGHSMMAGWQLYRRRSFNGSQPWLPLDAVFYPPQANTLPALASGSLALQRYMAVQVGSATQCAAKCQEVGGAGCLGFAYNDEPRPNATNLARGDRYVGAPGCFGTALDPFAYYCYVSDTSCTAKHFAALTSKPTLLFPRENVLQGGPISLLTPHAGLVHHTAYRHSPCFTMAPKIVILDVFCMPAPPGARCKTRLKSRIQKF